jgi:TolB-like protein/DNA-binding winged helix-turn-helix (wHTH) protein/Tfp pilus assembly protein PilF
MSAVSAPRRIAFGDYVVDVDSFELRKHDLRLKIQDQPFQILKLLLENPGQLVTRDRMRAELWTESTFVDFDAGLNAAVRRLRDVLNDSADEPRYIETLPRHGYRFIAEVRNLTPPSDSFNGEMAESGIATPPAVLERAPAGLKQFSWTFLFAAAFFLALVLVLRNTRRSPLVSQAASSIRSIAVLPLANLSGDRAREYFADGMTDALITDLAHISSLRVISRNSTIRYKGTKKSIPEIAKELNVDAIIEGAVVQEGDHIRISAQLLRASPEEHLWAKNYDRELKDVLSLENQVAQDIATQVRVKLSPGESRQISKIETQNSDAYQAFLLGRYYRTRGDDTDTEKGVAYLHRAIKLDPNFVSPYIELAEEYCFYDDLPEGRDGALKLIATALELDPMSPEGHAVQGCFYLRQDWDFTSAEHEYRRAVELGPNSVLAHQWMSNYLWMNDQQDEAMKEAQAARSLDPLSLENNVQIGLILYSQRQYSEAARAFSAVIEMDPRFFMGHRHLLRVYDQSGDIPHALETAKWWFCDPAGTDCEQTKELRSIYETRGTDAYWAKRVELEEARALDQAHGNSKVASFALAELHARLGHRKRALILLDRLYDERDDGLIMWLKSNPAFDSLKNDRRFQDMLRHVGFPPDLQAAQVQ